MKKENGITLIALIITIIVMLILVGVTINVALNGGLIDKARTAQNLTQKQVEKEELISAALGAYSSKNDNVTLSELASAINDLVKFSPDTTGKSVEGSTYVVKGESGTYWEIDLKSAEVREYKEQSGNQSGDQPVEIDLSKTYTITFKNTQFTEQDLTSLLDKHGDEPLLAIYSAADYDNADEAFGANDFSTITLYSEGIQYNIGGPSGNENYRYNPDTKKWEHTIGETTEESSIPAPITGIKIFPSNLVSSVGYEPMTSDQLNAIADLTVQN